MALYSLPHPGRTVRWSSALPNTVVKFGRDGSLVVLHASTDDRLTAAHWLTAPVEVGLFVSPATGGLPVPPALAIQLAGTPALAAPVCLVELPDPCDSHAWINARPALPTLRLALLRLSAKRPGEAVLEVSRRLWASEWVEAEEGLCRLLAQQCRDTPEATAVCVREAGWQLLDRLGPAQLLERAQQRVAEPGYERVLHQPVRS